VELRKQRIAKLMEVEDERRRLLNAKARVLEAEAAGKVAAAAAAGGSGASATDSSSRPT